MVHVMSKIYMNIKISRAPLPKRIVSLPTLSCIMSLLGLGVLNDLQENLDSIKMEIINSTYLTISSVIFLDDIHCASSFGYPLNNRRYSVIFQLNVTKDMQSQCNYMQESIDVHVQLVIQIYYWIYGNLSFSHCSLDFKYTWILKCKCKLIMVIMKIIVIINIMITISISIMIDNIIIINNQMLYILNKQLRLYDLRLYDLLNAYVDV